MATRINQQNQTQEKILDAAAQLFYEKDLQAVSVDDIRLRAGIAKMTLYNYFTSKDELIKALVVRNEKRWWDWFTIELRRCNKTSPKQFLVIFDLLTCSIEKTSCKNQLFTNMKFQVIESMHPIFLVSESFLKKLEDCILDRAKLAKITDPHQLTTQFMILVVGLHALCSLNNPKSLKASLYNTKKLLVNIIKLATQI